MKDATLAQAIKLLTLIEQDGTPCEQLQYLLASGLFSDLLRVDFKNRIIDRKEFRRVIGLKPPETFLVEVNYNRSIMDAVMVGKYDWSNSHITKQNFPFPIESRGVTELEIILIKFEIDVDYDYVLTQLEKRRLRPVNLLELLAFGEQYPDVQFGFPVVAFGSRWESWVPCLCGEFPARNRRLDLCGLSFKWESKVRFAAVRK